MNQDTTSANSSVVLSQRDVERLLKDDSPASRTSVLEKVILGYNSESLQGREREIAEQIFRLLMKDVALRVRETLSDRLKDNASAPRDIVLHLANDVESVASPLLTNSKVLSDSDLVSIVEKSYDMGKLLAVSKRESVSPRVSEALVETRYEEVVMSLLTNEGASITDRSFEKIAEDFHTNSELINALTSQANLPIAVVERIISQVSHDVANTLKAKYQLTDNDVEKGANQSREDVMVLLLERSNSTEEVYALAKQMAAEDRLTPSIAMTALCRGHLTFFIGAIAEFAHIPVENAEQLIADRGEHGFNGIYQKSGLPESMMDAVRLLLRAVQDMQIDKATAGSMQYANRLAERVIAIAGTQPIEYLPYFIALIRQNQHRI